MNAIEFNKFQRSNLSQCTSVHFYSLSLSITFILFTYCHNEDGRIQLRKREFITSSNTQRELNGAFRRAEAELP